MERIVKFRLINFDVDLGNGKSKKTRVNHGGHVSTDLSGDDPEVTYGLSEKDLARLDALGAFYPEGKDEATLAEEEVVLEYGQMSSLQIAEIIRTRGLTENQILHIVQEKPALANLFLQAESEATGGEPRAGVVMGIEHVMANPPADKVVEPIVVPPLEPDTPTQSAAGESDEPGYSGEEDKEPEKIERPDPPKKNASKAAWFAYHLACGKTPDELKGLTRDALADLVDPE